MTSHCISGIGELLTMDPQFGEGRIGLRRDAALVIDDGVIVWIGDSSNAPAADEHTDAAGRCVLPGFVDSHAHPIFAGDRAEEFAARMSGTAYEAGGIRSTVAATREASDQALGANLDRLVAEFHRSGVTTFEAKSGYGLTTHDEERSLRIAMARTQETTYLGAHVVPIEFADDPAGYVALVTGPMLDACAPYARWIDVFCDRGAFDEDQARTILQAGVAHGLIPRVHANQLQYGPGIQLAVEFDAASADHCTYVTDEDVAALAYSDTVATLLPGAEFSTRSPYPDARRLIDAGVCVALATDCNPGTSYTTSMPWCIAMAVREMHMTPAEAVWSATVGGAHALRRTDVGRLIVGSQANLVVLDAPSYLHLAYRPGVDCVDLVFAEGVVVRER